MNKFLVKILYVLGFFIFLALLLIVVSFLLFLLNISYPDINTIKNLGESLKPLIEIVAIVTAGLWSYRLFIKTRTEYPFADINHNIKHINLENGKRYLCVFVKLKNSGKVLLNIESSKVFVQQITPLLNDIQQLIETSDFKDIREGKVQDLFINKGTQVAWKEIGYRETNWDKNEIVIEPEEQEEFQFDFILDDESQIIKITTFFKNIKLNRQNIGWKNTSIYDLDKGVNMSKKDQKNFPHVSDEKKSQTAPKRPPSKPSTPSQSEPERTDPKRGNPKNK